MKPKLLLVGRGPYHLPLAPGLERRFDALSEVLEWRQLSSGSGSGDPRFVLARPFPVARLDGLVYHLVLPVRIVRQLRAFAPDAVLVQGAQETALALLARTIARSDAAVILDLHGDWRTPTRLYGSGIRRLLNPVADALARRGLRDADAVRTVTAYTTGLAREVGVEPVAEFPAYMDFASFTDRPPAELPATPGVVFVGVLERYKAFDVLAAAWRRVAGLTEDATLHLVGRGSLASVAAELVGDLPGRVVWDEELSPAAIARALDEATVLVLPSRSEGMGRVVIEALCRGRGVVAANVGGIPDLIRHEENGLLVPAGDVDALTDALLGVLTDARLAADLAAGASASAPRWVVAPDEFARRMEALVTASVARRRA